VQVPVFSELFAGCVSQIYPSDCHNVITGSGVPGGGVQTPSPLEIPKARENRAKLNPFVKTVKNCSI